MECNTEKTLKTGRQQKEFDNLHKNKGYLNIKTTEIINPLKIKVELLSNHTVTITFLEKYPFIEPIVQVYYYHKIIEQDNYSPGITLEHIILHVNKIVTNDVVQEEINRNIIIEKHNNTLIQLLKSKNKDLKIVIGAGNVDAEKATFEGLDYTNFSGNYDVGITNYKEMVDFEKTDFLALDFTIDDNFFTESITTRLKNSCSIVIFDFYVSKSFHNNKGIHMLIDMLIPETGCLFIENQCSEIDIAFCDRDNSQYFQTQFDRNFGKAFMLKYKTKLGNVYAQTIMGLSDKVDENNELYFKNMFQNSEYEIKFEIITGNYPLHKGNKNGFPNTKYYKITKVCK